jgi:hypothetical protein
VNRTLSILDANNLTTPESAERFAFTKGTGEIRAFTEGIRQAVLEDTRRGPERPPTIDDANFLPSCSLRGDGGCDHWTCRAPKIQGMARYVALYCDKAIVPMRLRWTLEGEVLRADTFERGSICSAIMELIELRPLIEAKLALVVPSEIQLCKQHWDEGIPGYERVLKAAHSLARRNARFFSVTYEPPRGPLGTPAIRFKGPEDYLEHGSIIAKLNSVPKWATSLRPDRPTRLTREIIKKRGLVDRFFLRIANDAFLQTYFGAAFGARYVTDSVGEADFFKTLYGRQELARDTATLCAHLAHTVPLMTDIPINSIIELRRSEPEAFQNYRSALSTIVKNHAGGGRAVTEKDAREIYLDVLKPAVDALQTTAANVRRGQIKKGMLKVATSSLLIGLGIYGGILPSQMVELVKAIGGFSVVKDLAETLATIERNPNEIRNHNLYFLLRLKQEGRSG